MTSLVTEEQIQKKLDRLRGLDRSSAEAERLMDEIGEESLRLVRENVRYRAALREIADGSAVAPQQIAREALEETAAPITAGADHA